MSSRNLFYGFLCARHWCRFHVMRGMLLLYLTVCLSLLSLSQEQIPGVSFNNYRAVKWSRQDGISIAKKNVMLQDVYGFLWIISPVGLNRFDGNSFKIFYPDNRTPGTIAGAYSFSLVEDSLHNIWVGTNKGVSRFDIYSDTFTNFSPRVLSVSSAATVIPFWATREKIFCVEAGHQLVSYDARKLEKTYLMQVDAQLPKVNDATIPHSVFDEKTQSVWIINGQPGNSGGLMQLQHQQKKIQQHTWPCFKNIPGHIHYAYGMQYDQKRYCIWINSVDGLLRFDLADNSFHAIDVCSDLNENDDYEIMQGIELDRDGKIWYETNPRGILVYDPATGKVNPLFSDSLLQLKISAGNMSIYMDHDGLVWLGGLDNEVGPHQLIPHRPAVNQIHLPGNHLSGKNQPTISKLVQAPDSVIWIGTNFGLYTYNAKTGTVRPCTELEFPGISKHVQLPLGVNESIGKAWLYDADLTSFLEIDLSTRSVKALPVKGLSDKELKEIFPNPLGTFRYKDGVLFSIDKKGLFYVDPQKAEVRKVLDLPYHVTNFGLGAGNSIFLRLNFGYTNLCFTETNGIWKRTPRAIDSVEWSCINYDSTTSSYWVGGVKQLYHFDNDFRLLKRYTEADGLPGMDELSILVDNLGNVWFNNSQGGLSVVNAGTGLLSVITEKEGQVAKRYNWGSPTLKSNDGSLYFASDGVADRIIPTRVDSIPHSKVYLKEISVDGINRYFSEGLRRIKNIRVNYDEWPLSISAGVINYYDGAHPRLRYKLTGLSENWDYAAGNHVIRYESLPPGRYTLVIESSNSGNNFNGVGVSLEIEVVPAFWTTWWFISAVLFVIAAVGILLIRFRLKETYQRRLEKFQQENQLAALRQAKTEMEMQALRAQMNPHFIFNSLNSINRFILQNKKLEASEYLTKFSKLIRLILFNSKASVITLENELDALKLYLELECLRFHDHFSYSIEVAEEIDTYVIKIPPLIIQPYAENAIWHGLMNKESRGSLDIKLWQEGDMLCIQVTDDGIGRAAASSLRTKPDALHEPVGLQITADRIARVSKDGSLKPSIQITDLVLPDGSAGGTNVLIQIPVAYD